MAPSMDNADLNRRRRLEELQLEDLLTERVLSKILSDDFNKYMLMIIQN